MTLGELLLELRENVLHDRSDQINGVTDQLWSDTTLIRYIDQAQNVFIRRTGYIRDGNTDAVTEITILSGQTIYKLNPTVIGILSAKLEGATTDLARAGHTNLDTYSKPDTYFFDVNSLAMLPPGKPLAFTTDEYLDNDVHGSTGLVVFRLYPEPSIDYNNQVINLRVIRKAITPLTLRELSAVPEIPEEYHFDLLDYAAYLALRIVDHDAGNVSRAAEFLSTWKDKLDKAEIELRRKLFAPTVWGFGRNGFMWEGNGGY